MPNAGWAHHVPAVNEVDKTAGTRLDATMLPNQLGMKQKRVITSISAHEMKYRNPTSVNGGQIELVWKRARWAPKLLILHELVRPDSFAGRTTNLRCRGKGGHETDAAESLFDAAQINPREGSG
jgi:hypothetical protein